MEGVLLINKTIFDNLSAVKKELLDIAFEKLALGQPATGTIGAFSVYAWGHPAWEPEHIAILGQLANQLASYTNTQVKNFIKRKLNDDGTDGDYNRAEITRLIRQRLAATMQPYNEDDDAQVILDKQAAPQNAIRFISYEQFQKMFVADNSEKL